MKRKSLGSSYERNVEFQGFMEQMDKPKTRGIEPSSRGPDNEDFWAAGAESVLTDAVTESVAAPVGKESGDQKSRAAPDVSVLLPKRVADLSEETDAPLLLADSPVLVDASVEPVVPPAIDIVLRPVGEPSVNLQDTDESDTARIDTVNHAVPPPGLPVASPVALTPLAPATPLGGTSLNLSVGNPSSGVIPPGKLIRSSVRSTKSLIDLTELLVSLSPSAVSQGRLQRGEVQIRLAGDVRDILQIIPDYLQHHAPPNAKAAFRLDDLVDYLLRQFIRTHFSELNQMIDSILTDQPIA